MDLRSYFLEIARGYDRMDGMDAPIQAVLRSANSHLADEAPVGIQIQGSGGKGVATYTPWVGFFDPDITSNPQEGLYVVYLFSADLETINLSLNQGMEYLRSQYKNSGARQILKQDAAHIRAELEKRLLVPTNFNDPIDLGRAGERAKAYEAGSIANRAYHVAELPGIEEMRTDLSAALRLLQQSATIKDELLVESPGSVSSPGTKRSTKIGSSFKPKDGSDYRAKLQAMLITKSRRHEILVERFGLDALTAGFEVATPHPIDLTLSRSDVGLMVVEAKMVRNGDARPPVREAIGQLFDYRYFYFAERSPQLVALFSEGVGEAYLDLLTSLGIHAAWRSGQSWDATTTSLRFTESSGN